MCTYIYIRRDSRRRCTHPICIYIYIYKPERETLQGMIERSRRPVTTTGSSLGSGCVSILNQHTSAYVSIRQYTPVTTTGSSLGSGCVSILRSAVCLFEV